MNHRITSASRLRTGLALLLATPFSSLLAHPGHGHETIVAPEQPAHWFIEPEHALTWMLLGVLTWAAFRVLQQRTLRTEPVTETHR